MVHRQVSKSVPMTVPWGREAVLGTAPRPGSAHQPGSRRTPWTRSGRVSSMGVVAYRTQAYDAKSKPIREISVNVAAARMGEAFAGNA
jgi:hypothetical protein